ncbi:Uracil-DNA glycosylase, family 4 [Dissulfuribacter thermophilus]|uniref:Type-4 uracil-DNA glycosylase n=1 Tax=Dissulfuribacter thermophilus TaxID=1156395 RepID=A0A1B9F3M2_9BACT|nr:uracil-DNA glycosylase [Dissulfuribacter thermophilus]OCC14434.1 Uracil-DNA glycosylase, family 4 [Dissulfuribacter thermophilus]
MNNNPILNWLKYQKEKGVSYIARSEGIERLFNDLKLLKLEIETCTRCPLYKVRNHAVFGEGPLNASLIIVGEAPGREEDIEGRPFCGPSGELLDRMLKAIHLSREEIFITSVVKCRPPQNRAPLSKEIKACIPYLETQIKSIRPKAILALGEVAGKALTKANLPVKELRGKIHPTDHGQIIVTYHPAYILRFSGSQQEKAIKKAAWEDLQLLEKVLSGD